MAHDIHITKEEEKEIRILDGLPKDNVYSIVEINTGSRWCSYHHFESHDTVDCKAHINRSKPPTKCCNCNEDHFVKNCPKPKELAQKNLNILNKPYTQHLAPMLIF